MPCGPVRAMFVRKLSPYEDAWLAAYVECLQGRGFLITESRLKYAANYILVDTRKRGGTSADKPLEIGATNLKRWINEHPSFKLHDPQKDMQPNRLLGFEEHKKILELSKKTILKEWKWSAKDIERGECGVASGTTSSDGFPAKTATQNPNKLLQKAKPSIIFNQGNSLPRAGCLQKEQQNLASDFGKGVLSRHSATVNENTCSDNNNDEIVEQVDHFIAQTPQEKSIESTREIPRFASACSELHNCSEAPCYSKMTTDMAQRSMTNDMADKIVDIPETSVLAIASHVVHGYVGNKVASFVLQVLGCEVAVINTVNYSNHTGYKEFQGTKTFPHQIWDLFTGLESVHAADDFNVVLSGYLPSAEAIEMVGKIVERIREKKRNVFWILDPVMGDNGKYYVPVSSTPAYRALLPTCDLVLPNQFELEVLTEHPVSSVTEVINAIGKLHDNHDVKHVLITSTEPSLAKQAFEAGIISPLSKISSSDGSKAAEEFQEGYMLLIGSTRNSSNKPRAFALMIPRFPVSFTGTGDMFSALLTAYFRAMVAEAGISEDQPGWISPDAIQAIDLPLAKAAELTVEVMQRVLSKTFVQYNKETAVLQNEELTERSKHVKMMKALELKVVRSVRDMLDVQPTKCRFKAVRLNV